MTATTFRKISRDSGAGTQSEKVKIKLTIQIESVDYDAEGKVWLPMACCNKQATNSNDAMAWHDRADEALHSIHDWGIKLWPPIASSATKNLIRSCLLLSADLQSFV